MLNDLEKFVVEQFIKEMSESSQKINLDNVRVAERTYTGVGFMTEIEESSRPRILPLGRNFTGGNLILRVNKSIETGYVLYIKDGFLEAIEGHLYGGTEWPDHVDSFCVSDIKVSES